MNKLRQDVMKMLRAMKMRKAQMEPEDEEKAFLPFSVSSELPEGLPEDLRQAYQRVAAIARSNPKAILSQGLIALARDPETIRRLEAAHRVKALETAGRVLGSLQVSSAIINCADIIVLGSAGLYQLAKAASVLEQMGIGDLTPSELQSLKDLAIVSSVMEDGMESSHDMDSCYEKEYVKTDHKVGDDMLQQFFDS